MIGSMGNLLQNYVQCLLGVSVIALVIMLLRKFICKKVSKCFVYAMWILIPVYMLLVPFVRIPMPQFVSEIIQEEEEKEKRTDTPLTIQQDIVTQEATIRETLPVPNVGETLTPVNRAGVQEVTSINADKEVISGIHLNANVILKNIYVLLVALFFTVILSVNYRFQKQCKRGRKYLYPSEGIGLPVYQLEDISSPFIMGRCIYLPENMEDGEEIRYAILHEECHFRHGDPLWILVRYFVLGIFFYNPIIWLAFQYAGHDCELACDEAVMGRIQETERIRYGGCLLNAVDANRKMNKHVILSTNMKSSKKLLKQRIENIAYKRKRSIGSMLLAVSLLLSVTCCALLGETPVAAKGNAVKAENQQSLSDIESTEGERTISVSDGKHKYVEYNDWVSVCLELKEGLPEQTEEGFAMLESGREYTFRVNQEESSFGGLEQICEESTILRLLEELPGKEKGEEVTLTEKHFGWEYYFTFVILDVNEEHATSYRIPANWAYSLPIAYTKNFYTEGENSIESDAGKLYGFPEKFNDYGSHYIIGSRLFYTNAEASSTLAPQGHFAYAASNATTYARFCTWCEGAEGDGIGESIELRQLYFGPGEEVLTFDELCIVNGYAENEKKWRENNRVKSLKFYYEDVYMGTIELEDTIQPQYIDLTPLQLTVRNGREASFRFEIAEVYEGTRYEDTCITGIEISFQGKETVK